jgi:virginiamycin A acetyltransferase|nr:CatB-related O-acetyltransferase [Ensifer adhaerens]
MTTITDGTRENARALGINCSHLSGVGGRLKVEVPVSINSAAFAAECSLGFMSYVGMGARVTATDIGRYCAIAPNVEIGPAEHPTSWFSIHPFQYNGTKQFDHTDHYASIVGNQSFNGNASRTTIGNDVWIGDGVFIRRGTKIGDGAIIAARSVITKDVPPYSIVVGVPGRVIRSRFSAALVDRFLRVKWWDFDISPLKGKMDFQDSQAALDAIEAAIEQGIVHRRKFKRFEVHGGKTPRIVEIV